MMQREGFWFLASKMCAVIAIAMCCVVITQLPGAARAGDADDSIVIRGSSTLQPVVEQWADSFGQKTPSPQFEIVATGTSEGIDDLLAGQADIAMASRPMNQEELSQAHGNGLTVRETIVARMGIAVVVNQQNSTSSIAVDKLAEVFSGGIRNWRQVGGPNETIVVVRKDSGWSPDFFKRRIMGTKDFIRDAVVVDSKEDVVAEVASRPWSIGVTGMPEAIPALDRVKLVRMVNEDSAEDSTYALSRPLFFFTIEGSQSVQRFLDYVAKEKAQQMIIETGFYPAYQDDSMAEK